MVPCTVRNVRDSSNANGGIHPPDRRSSNGKRPFSTYALGHLLAMVGAQPDLYLNEIVANLARLGIDTSKSAIHRALNEKLHFSLKKKHRQSGKRSPMKRLAFLQNCMAHAWTTDMVSIPPQRPEISSCPADSARARPIRFVS